LDAPFDDAAPLYFKVFEPALLGTLVLFTGFPALISPMFYSNFLSSWYRFASYADP
jgi:hypothetical protein